MLKGHAEQITSLMVTNQKRYLNKRADTIFNVISLLREGMESTGTGTLHYNKMRDAVETLSLLTSDYEAGHYTGFGRGFDAGYDAGRESLRAENNRLREALEHYADEQYWKSGRGGTKRIYNVGNVYISGYDKAREALEGKVSQNG